MSIEEKITKLTDIWYQYVGMNHHKDRDCHWYINRVWSYGQPPYYLVEHDGYIFDDCISSKFDNYKDAELHLLDLMINAIENEQGWAVNVLKSPSEWDADQIKQAKFITSINLNEWRE